MLVVGGYAMSFETAKVLGEAHIPNLKIGVLGATAVASQKTKDRMDPKPELNVEVIGVFKKPKSWVVFVTHAIDDPAATPVNYKTFRESDTDKEFKEKYLSEESAARTVQFATVFNPYNM